MTDNKDELRECPFCACNAEILPSKRPKGGFLVKCVEFDCQTARWGATRTSAIKAWNTRATDTQLELAVKALRNIDNLWGDCTNIAQQALKQLGV